MTKHTRAHLTGIAESEKQKYFDNPSPTGSFIFVKVLYQVELFFISLMIARPISKRNKGIRKKNYSLTSYSLCVEGNQPLTSQKRRVESFSVTVVTRREPDESELDLKWFLFFNVRSCFKNLKHKLLLVASRKNIQQPFDLMALITGKVMLITNITQLNLIFLV